MHRSPIENQLKEIVLSKGFETIKSIPVQICDLVIRHPKLGLNIFFKLFTAGRDLIENWIKAQEEVRENLELHAEILNRHNTYIVFLLPVEELPPIRDVQPIISDEYVCRKLIAPIEDKNIQKSLVRLPFYPFDISELPKEAIPKNVVEALADSGFPYQLISDLAGRVSEKTILRKLKENLYKHEKHGPQKIQKESIQENYPIYSTRLKNISIKNFRGIGKKLDLDTNTDIVIIYGMNGTGKTSIIDAIEWTVTGEVERLWGKNYDKPLNANESMINLFSKEQVTEVKIEFSRNGRAILGKRHIDLSKSKSSQAEIDNKRIWNDKTMIREIVGSHMPQVDVRRLRGVFLRSHFLGQHTILDFITQDPEKRYDAFSHMVGTQDYILFNEKISSVIRVLERDMETKLKHKNELNEEIMNISLHISRKKQIFKRLKKSIKEEVSTQNLMYEIRKLIEDLNIKVPRSLIMRKKELPEIEEANKLIEIISTFPPIADRKINVLNSLLIEAKNEEIRVHERGKITLNMDEYIKKISELQKKYSSKESSLNIIQKKIKEHSRQKEIYNKQMVNIKWLIEILPQYHRTQEVLAEEHKHIEEFSKKRSSIQTKIKENKEQLSKVTEDLQKSQKEIENINQTLGYLIQIKENLPEWREHLKNVSQIGESVRELNKEIAKLQQKKSELEKELEATIKRVDSIEYKLDIEKEKQTRKLELITKLKEYLDSPECPLCGHNWGKTEKLGNQVEKRLLHLTSMLHDLGHLSLEKVKDLESLLKSLVVLASDHENLLKKKSQMERQIKGLTQKIELKLTKVKQLENEEAKLKKEIKDWDKIIKHLKDKHLEFEERIIPDQTRVLILLQGYQLRLDALEVSQEEANDKAIAFNRKIKSIENTQKAIEKQIISHQKKENYYVDELDQINKEITKRELINIKNQDVSALHRSIEELLLRTEAVKREINKIQSECQKMEAELSDMENHIKKLIEKRNSLNAHLNKLKEVSETFRNNLQKEGISPNDTLQKIIKEIENKKEGEIEFFKKCKYLQSLIEQLKSIVTMDEVERELRRMQEEEAEKEKLFNDIASDYRDINEWNDSLKKMKKIAEEKRKEQEKSHFNMYGPAANLIYSRLNPHPLFDKILLKIGEKELKVLAQSSESKQFMPENINQISPRQFFSEAQLNIVALSMFLATALYQKWSGFNTIIIDDPVQNMDDFNVYAFLDLVRGLIENSHQFILTTCNRDLYKLMLIKFKDLNKGDQSRFKAYRLKGIYTEGPELRQDL